jgi:hypothetical protein
MGNSLTTCSGGRLQFMHWMEVVAALEGKRWRGKEASPVAHSAERGSLSSITYPAEPGF